ncbi:MAG: glycosyltransferase [Chitinophagaceae bacterium]
MISIIIPCYNHGRFVADAIKSLQAQTYDTIEVIVVNDGSTDETEEVVRRIKGADKRVHLYTFPNGGLGLSRNRGLEIAKGEYIQFLDADDIIEYRKFEEQLKIFSQNPDADVVYGSVRYFEKNPFDPADRKLTYWGPDKEWMPKLTGFGKDILPQALKGNFSHLSSPLFKRSIVDKVGLFDNEISAVADYHFLLRSAIANAYFIYHDTPETYSLVRWHLSNMSKDPSYMRNEEIKMREKLMPLLDGNSEALNNNTNAIKGLTMLVKSSWKTIFLSGGPLDFLKKGIRALGLEKAFQKILYK